MTISPSAKRVGDTILEYCAAIRCNGSHPDPAAHAIIQTLLDSELAASKATIRELENRAEVGQKLDELVWKNSIEGDDAYEVEDVLEGHYKERDKLRAQLAAAETGRKEFIDLIHKETGAPEWEYPGQVIRDVGIIRSERDALKSSLAAVEKERDEAKQILIRCENSCTEVCSTFPNVAEYIAQIETQLSRIDELLYGSGKRRYEPDRVLSLTVILELAIKSAAERDAALAALNQIISLTFAQAYIQGHRDTVEGDYIHCLPEDKTPLISAEVIALRATLNPKGAE